MRLNKEYWSSRYRQNDVPWDAGTITRPLKTYIDQLIDKELKILIPGVGNGHELTYLFESGFKNVYGLDLSEAALNNFKAKNPSFPEQQLIEEDFFQHNDTYDLILEQTFFCAITPELRPLYAEKAHQLLNENGTLAGVLFRFPLTEKGPPFGGNKKEYERLFKRKFKIKVLEECYNSIKPRQNNELFIIIKK